MRALNVCCLLLCWLLARIADASPFEEANQLFDAGKFAEAREQYERLVKSGARDANVFYNLGNTHFRLGAIGPAILSYERTLALDPAHPEARANLALVREQSGARAAERTWIDRLILPATPNTYALIASACFWAGVIVLVWRLVRKRTGALAWMTLIAVWSIAAYSAAAAWHLRGNETLAIILAKEADARLAPADRAGLAEKLPAGSRVRVLSERGAWIYCELPGSGRGWLPSAALERVYLPSA
ncbi:MAG TPA: tetratricopeptide repeat protein [Chthoniobacteraceae bacterium]|jgi:tetratricopeptide (TPR) repeat protein